MEPEAIDFTLNPEEGCADSLQSALELLRHAQAYAEELGLVRVIQRLDLAKHHTNEARLLFRKVRGTPVPEMDK